MALFLLFRTQALDLSPSSSRCSSGTRRSCTSSTRQKATPSKSTAILPGLQYGAFSFVSLSFNAPSSSCEPRGCAVRLHRTRRVWASCPPLYPPRPPSPRHHHPYLFSSPQTRPMSVHVHTRLRSRRRHTAQFYIYSAQNSPRLKVQRLRFCYSGSALNFSTQLVLVARLVVMVVGNRSIIHP